MDFSSFAWERREQRRSLENRASDCAMQAVLTRVTRLGWVRLGLVRSGQVLLC